MNFFAADEINTSWYEHKEHEPRIPPRIEKITESSQDQMASSFRCDVVGPQDKSQEIKNKNMGAEYQFLFPVNLIDII